jgi:hypothetical protein
MEGKEFRRKSFKIKKGRNTGNRKENESKKY